MATQRTPVEACGVPAHLAPLVTRLNASDGERWRPSRLIIRNYWLITRQDFLFVQGRLNLRGNNGLGKSTLLVPCTTLILDGDKRRGRLDTFGSGAKSVEDYLIGPERAHPKHPLYREERTGYLALEFQHASTDEYLTLGLGLFATRLRENRRADAWYFVVTDGRRVGEGLDLDEGGVPLDRKTLVQRLGSGGKVTESRDEYQGWVNDHLFSFPKIEEFHNLMEILVRLRTPKLSNELGPSRVATFLSDALPHLPEDLLSKVSNDIQELNSHRRDIKKKEKDLAAVEEIHRAQERVSLQDAQMAALEYRGASTNFETASRGLAEAQRDLAANRGRLERATVDLVAADRRLAEIGATLEALEGSDVSQKQRELETARREVETADVELQTARKNVRKEREAQSQIVRRLEKLAEGWEPALDSARNAVVALGEQMAPFRWPTPLINPAALASELRRESLRGDGRLADHVPVALLDREIRQRRSLIEPVIGCLRGLENAQADLKSAQQARAEAQAAYDAAVGARQQAIEDFAEARRALVRAIETWRGEVVHLRIEDATAAEVALRVAAYTSTAQEHRAVLAPISAVCAGRDEACVERKAAERQRITQAEARIAEIDTEIAQLRSELPKPEPRPGQEVARERLLAEGIVCMPLYAAVNLRSVAADTLAARSLESALEDAGLLDALIVDPARVEEVGALLDGDAADRWIRPAPVAGPTLLGVLQPAEGAPAAAVESALASIGLGLETDASSAVGLDGRWRAGALVGRASASTRERVIFVGVSNRALERERRIAALGAEQEEQRDVVRNAERAIAAADAEREQRAVEFDRLNRAPALDGLRQAARQQEDADTEVRSRWTTLQRREEEIGPLEARRDQARARLTEAQKKAPETESLDEAEVRALLEGLRDVREAATTAEQALKELDRLRGEQDRLEESSEEQAERVEGRVSAEAAVAERCAKLSGALEGLILWLENQAEGVRELARQRKALVEERAATEKRKTDAVAAQAVSGSKVKSLEEQTPGLEIARSDMLELERDAADALERKIKAYPGQGLEEAEALFGGPEGPLGAALYLLRNRSGTAADMRKNISKDLTDNRTLLTRAQNTDDARALPYPIEMREMGCVFRVRGADRKPIHLLRDLKTEVETLRQTITEKDHELFSDFLLNKVANTVRDLIFRAQREVRKLNELLSQHPLSHGQVIHLKWAPTTSSDPKKGVAAKELADLVTRGSPDLMSDPDRERFGRLLRRRIEAASHGKNSLESPSAKEARPERRGREENEESFAVRIERALDYRAWHDFRIYLVHPDGSEALLDDEEFRRHSGGEKSLNLFIPLLAAVDVRYTAARNPAAPRMIGLDEAFAGVDQEKTRRMFDLLRKFDFSWIMTSEKLWGLAPDLPGCATYNLHMRESVLLPVLHLWDGTRLRDGLAGEPTENGNAALAHV